MSKEVKLIARITSRGDVTQHMTCHPLRLHGSCLVDMGPSTSRPTPSSVDLFSTGLLSTILTSSSSTGTLSSLTPRCIGWNPSLRSLQNVDTSSPSHWCPSPSPCFRISVCAGLWAPPRRSVVCSRPPYITLRTVLPSLTRR